MAKTNSSRSICSSVGGAGDHSRGSEAGTEHSRYVCAHHAKVPIHSAPGAGWVEEACAICLEEWSEDDDVVILPCMHRLHRACATEWAVFQADGPQLCPTCRGPMFLD